MPLPTPSSVPKRSGPTTAWFVVLPLPEIGPLAPSRLLQFPVPYVGFARQVARPVQVDEIHVWYESESNRLGYGVVRDQYLAIVLL